MKQRFIREGDELKDNSSVVVRGGPLDPEVITPDALRHHDIYGTYGISVFAIRDTTLDELAQQPPLIRFELLTVIVVGVLREAGLLLQPTGVIFDISQSSSMPSRKEWRSCATASTKSRSTRTIGNERTNR